MINPALYFRNVRTSGGFIFPTGAREAIIAPLSIKDECADAYVTCENSGSDRDIRGYLARGISPAASTIRGVSHGNKYRYDFPSFAPPPFLPLRAIYGVTAPVIQRVSNLQAAAIRDLITTGEERERASFTLSVLFAFITLQNAFAGRLSFSIRSLPLRFVPLGITVVHTEKRITIATMALRGNLYVGESRWIMAPL